MEQYTPGPYEMRETRDMIAIAQVGHMPHATVFNRASSGALKQYVGEQERATANLFKEAPAMADLLRRIDGVLDNPDLAEEVRVLLSRITT